MDQYQIAFTSLASGMHTFDFQVGDRFFEQVEDAEITSGDVLVAVEMAKEERMMDLHITISGKVKLPCDRCNELLEVEVAGTERLIVKLGEGYVEESEDVQIIPETSHQFDLEPFIYEYIHLLLPIRRVHEEDEHGNSLCDPEVLNKLNELNGHHGPDPRWDVLKGLRE